MVEEGGKGHVSRGIVLQLKHELKARNPVERGPTYFTCLLKIPVHYHSDIYSPILPHEEGYGIQAFSRYLCLVQHNK